VDVGPQNWSTTNLRVTTYRNGDTIPFAADASEWLAYNSTQTGAWRYYNDDPSTELIYGKWYNSYAMKDTRFIAPTGYHIPTLEEWPLLNNYLSSQSQSMSNLKNISLNVWTPPNTDAINAYLFEAVPGGAIFYNGNSYNINGWAYYWMYTQGDNPPFNAPRYAYFGFNGSSAPDGGITFNGQGMCVRIIDNDSLVVAQPFGGGMLLENTGTEGITAWTSGTPEISAIVLGSDSQWGCVGLNVGATSNLDGYTNTQLMAARPCNNLVTALGNPILFYNDYNDWYIPAIDEVLQQIQAVPEYEILLIY
jgi:uncharacterized protein (TIGR02145 family)